MRRFVLYGIVALEAFLGILLAFAAFPLFASENLQPAAEEKPSSSLAPWGDLSVNFLPLESSEVAFPDRLERLQAPSWYFPSTSLAQVTNFLQTLSLSSEARRELLAASRWQQVSNVWKINPSIAIIQGLEPAARGELYTVLAKHPANYNQRFPIRFTPENFGERFAASKLSSAQLSQVRALCYTNLGYIAFCDFETSQGLLPAPAFDQLIKVLYSLPSVQVSLRIAPGADVEPLVKYWGRNQKEGRVRPLLESVASKPLGGEIDIISLMPAFARLHLYTFPVAGEDSLEGKIDCFISSLNFFNPEPELRFLETAVRTRAIDNDYYAIETKPAFGDLFMLLNEKGVAVHMAVYIADDILFTKNGISYRQPWCFMRIPDMMTYYPGSNPYKVVFLRHK